MKYCLLCDHEYPEDQRFCEYEGAILSLHDPYQLVRCTIADKYRIEALISAGGMGVIYAAHHLDFDYRVAFKILKPDMAVGRQRAEMIRLFEKEGKTAIRLTHHNIIRVMDAG